MFADNNHVVDIDGNVHTVAVGMANIDAWISIGTTVTTVDKGVVEFLIPGTTRLLQTIDSLVEATDHVLLAFDDEPFWLTHVELLLDSAIEICCLYIHLTHN